MRSGLRSRMPSHTTVVAYLALFLALGGGTTAVALQGRNTVNSRDIINQEVKSADLLNGGVTSNDVRDDSLEGGDILESSLAGVVKAGDSASGDVAGTYPGPLVLRSESVQAHNLDLIERTATVSVPAAGGIEGNGSYGTAGTTAECVQTETAISGGAYWDTEASDKELTISQMRLTNFIALNGQVRPKAFRAVGGNDTSQDHTLTVQVLCIDDGV